MSGKPIWPKIPAGFVRAMLAGHSALGLAFAALIWLVCFTGAIAVFTQEFHRWEAPEPTISEVSPENIDKAFQTVMKNAPWAHDVIINIPDTPQPHFTIAASHDEQRQEWIADKNGNIIKQIDGKWADFQAKLHYALHIPAPWGEYLVGLVGVALLSSIISGIFSHPRVFKDAFHLRLGGSKRLQEADIHNRIGVWGLPFHLIVSLTGAFLGLTTLIVGVLALAVFKGDINKAYALFLGPQPAENETYTPPPNLIKMYQYVKADAPNAKITYIFIEHPFEQGGRTTLNAESPRKLSRGESYLFNSKSEYIGVMGFEKGTLGQRIYSAVSPLHFGWFGGWAVKIIYGLLGLGLAAITSTGVTIWIARRRGKGKPVDIWERLWFATIWSQPPAYALSAITTFIAPQNGSENMLVAVWGIISLACFIPAIFMDGKRVSTLLRYFGVAAMLLLVAVHIYKFGLIAVDPVATIVNAWVLITAICILLSIHWNPEKFSK